MPGGSFGQLSRLSRLVLSSNGLGLLADSALDGLADLESLDLANNQLVALPPDVFRSACFVEVIHLTYKVTLFSMVTTSR